MYTRRRCGAWICVLTDIVNAVQPEQTLTDILIHMCQIILQQIALYIYIYILFLYIVENYCKQTTPHKLLMPKKDMIAGSPNANMK